MNNKNNTLITEHLVLKSCTKDDIDALLSIFYNEEIKKTFMIPDFPDRETAISAVSAFIRLTNDPQRFCYGIFLDGTLIGIFDDCEICGDTIEVGYAILPEYKGHGYATEALKVSIKELFRIGYNTIKAGFFEENPASGRVMEKAGMLPINEITEDEYHGTIHRCLYCAVSKNDISSH